MCKKRERPIIWTPEWHGSVEGWTRKHIAKNRWRYDWVHDPEDIYQDNYLIYLKICDKYPRVVAPAHFMSLYKRAVINKMHDKALYTKRKKAVHLNASIDVSEFDTDEFYAGRMGEMTNCGFAVSLLNEAPEELKLALNVLAHDGELLRTQSVRGAPRENLNGRLRRILGIGYDFTGALKALLA